ncbi:flagellar biosynthesis regulator FlaF [Alteriqipengyuania lutimaris]|uniref:Flagellar biosynthesis regulatory protein FlaF n=1 Tax=Alteriqipengyuania lutimaris TaxID=1538146 RepID=A0A395LMW6_9SPHN|nr:flagellar biosynthesis regulator FlaF [Alteriqipengyuania lutimaris]MBB3032508.1 flagellar protein FlaF [Alteriqipengyuania lutimaris]RDS78358.1 flagellar biosynthesis regulatory protein FlaF [Alteriqipengyuania lutimaris]
MSLAAYQSVRRLSEAPRDTEHRLMGQITGEMIAARDAQKERAELVEPLHRNREMWNLFSADCTSPGNGLPSDLRASIISIALWVDRFSSEVIAGREQIDDLIEVNRSVMEGLAAHRLASA